ncbi:MAG: sugar phosphate isomerase/epimerase [Candidatus Brocadiia bacterium]|jgi:sugar phosphate isomerase/epimerase|nr:sugar phosphate isomerase/epimerase [Candidatus Brocadiia bacterium]
MSKISYSTSGFTDRGVEAALDGVAAAGFPQAEILGQEPHLAEVPTGKALLDFRSRLESRGFSGCTVHAPLRTNVLGAPEEGWRREKVEVLADYIRFAGAIGASGVVIHAIPNPMFVPEAEAPDIPQLMHDAVLRSLDDLIPVAEQAGTRMLLENLPYECQYPFLTMKELRPLVDSYPAKALGLVIDTGHAWTMKIDPAEEIRLAGCRLGGTHLQDVDHDDPQDNHWVPTQGGLDWESIRSALAQVNYGGTWTFEPLHGRYGETPAELARICRSVAAGWGL